MSLHYFENGYYIPFIFVVIYFFQKDLFLATIISLKLFPANYYYHFSYVYNYLPGNFNMLKQFVRYTDSGHLISFLYYLFPNLICLAFNIHFVITFGYWISRIFFNLEDTDDRVTILNQTFLNFWITCNHSIPLMLLIYELSKIQNKDILFTNNDLYFSYLWSYTWLVFIYLPWRLVTNDPVYSVLSDEKPLYMKLSLFLLIKFLLLFSNILGWYLIKFI